MMLDKTFDTRLFLTPLDPASLATDELEAKLQELITSEDRRCAAFTLVISILHDEVLMEGSTVAQWLWPSLLLMVMVMMIAGADDDDNGLTIVILVLLDVVIQTIRPSCTNRKIKTWDRRKRQTKTSICLTQNIKSKRQLS